MRYRALAWIVSFAFGLEAAGQNSAPRFPLEAVPANSAPQTIEVADMNRDGRLDAVYGDITGSVNVLLGDGAGRLQTAGKAQPGSTWIERTAIADFTGDGKPDIAVLEAFVGKLHMVVGDGAGGLSVGSTVVAVSGDLTSGDIDGDGLPEVLLAGGVQGLLAFDVSTQGVLTPLPSVPSSGDARALALTDVSSDGIPDLLLALANPNGLVVRLGQGNGQYASQVFHPISGTPTALLFGHANGDQLVDVIVTASTSNAVFRLQGLGGGAFDAAKFIALGAKPTETMLVDATGDSNVDLLALSPTDGSFALRAGLGNGNFTGTTFQSLAYQPYAVACGDMNGDLRDDLLVAQSSAASVLTILADNDGFRLPETVTTAPSGGSAKHLVGTLADANGDGIDDSITIRSNASSIEVRLVGPNGQLQPPTTTDIIGLSTPQIMEAAHFNGDALIDVVILTNSGTHVLLSNGNASFTPLPAALPASRVGDFDGDGDPDVVAEENFGTALRLLQNDGNGILTPGPLTPLPYVLGVMEIADIDGDGVDDVASARLNNIRIYHGTPTGVFTAQQVIAPGLDPRETAFGDFNNDGNLDLVASSQLGAFAVHLGVGGGVLSPTPQPISIPMGFGYTVDVDAADFNGDGYDDIASAAFSESVGIVYGGPGANFDQASQYYAAVEVRSLATGHIGSPARTDLLVLGTAPELPTPGAQPAKLALFVDWCDAVTSAFGIGCAGSGGLTPRLALRGCFAPNEPVELELDQGIGGSLAMLLLGTAPASTPISPLCTLLIGSPLPVPIPIPLSGTGIGAGKALVSTTLPATATTLPFAIQAFVIDPGTPVGFSATNGVVVESD